MHIDIFCQVIDNYGDIGVCWRLAQQLSRKKTASISEIRLFVDDLSAFNRIEPRIQAHLKQQQVANITVFDWSKAVSTKPAALVIEAFGCELPAPYVAQMPSHTQLWLNLEYLSAEDWVADLHGMPSPQPNGLIKFFFFPGFTEKTGGLLRPETARRLQPDSAFWSRLGITEPKKHATAFVFSYPNAPLDSLYAALEKDTASWTVLLAATVPTPKNTTLPIQPLPYLSQADFDILLDYADLNVVRGEDSFVRAIWAAKPFIWQPYAQTEQTHLTKLEAWLAQTSFDATLQRTMQAWSQGSVEIAELQQLLQQRAHWQQQCADYALQLSQHSDLATQLLDFFANKTKNAKIAL